MLRFMFINWSDEDQTIKVRGDEKIVLWRLGTSSPEKLPEEPVSEHDKGSWSFILTRGMIFGFGASEEVRYTNPNPRWIQTVMVSNKDPWPPPPPPPPAYKDSRDFRERWQNFLIALGANMPSEPIVVTVE